MIRKTTACYFRLWYFTTIHSIAEVNFKHTKSCLLKFYSHIYQRIPRKTQIQKCPCFLAVLI